MLTLTQKPYERFTKSPKDHGGALLEYAVVIIVVGMIALVVWQAVDDGEGSLLAQLEQQLTNAIADIFSGSSEGAEA